MNEGLVSIIVPTHNRADMLARALNSIFRQTYENWETIVVANECNDNTAEIMEKYLNDKRFSFVNIPDKIGGAEARNVGLRKAKGEYIAFLDDDDEWLPEKLELQIDAISWHPDVAIVSSNFINICGRNNRIIKFPEFVEKSNLLYKNVLGSFSFCLTKAEFIKDIEIDKRLQTAQDWSFWFDILHRSNRKGYVVQKALVKYNNNDHINRLSLNKKNSYESYKLFINKIWNILSQEQKSYHLAMLYSKQNLLIKTDYFTKLKLSFKTLKMLILSKKLMSVRKIISLVIMPFCNLGSEGRKRVLYIIARSYL